MDIAPVYLLRRLFYYLVNFFHHWYVHGSRNIGHYFLALLERLDKTLAIKITFKYFFQPLYKDYTVIGRIFGVVFRSARILLGVGVYAVIGVALLTFYLGWLALPLLMIISVFKKL
ncbi:MAG: hypothetical protein HY093_02320 [Candidatus Liptonbacteria bacterium]|nr:hypothetical protein [Candidatus Liptonbacteria bacterium]